MNENLALDAASLVLESVNLSKSFREGQDAVEVLRGVSLSVARGERWPSSAPLGLGQARSCTCSADWMCRAPERSA